MSFQFSDKILLFSDGAAKGNPGPGGWGVVIVQPSGSVRELGGNGSKVTNNQMELLGVIEGLKFLRKTKGIVCVLTDSSYVLNGATKWVYGWRKRGWKTAAGGEVANRSYWEQLLELINERKAGSEIEWHYTRGHAGVAGNERVDEIASTLAQNKPFDMYDGPLLRYDVAVYDIPDDTSIPEPKLDSGSKSKKKAYSYVSLVNGEFQTHATWAECEARVKGRSGARFKKAMSSAEEEKLRQEWTGR